MMTIIFADIETIGTTDPAVIAEIAASIKPPGNISKAETIAKWEAESKPAAIDKAVRETSFDGGLGSIICIGWAVDDGEPQYSNGVESELIKRFFAAVQEATDLHYSGGVVDNQPIFCGHNAIGFDLRFLWQRAVVLGIKPPNCFPVNPRPFDKRVADTMLMWDPERAKRVPIDSESNSNANRAKHVSLDRLCRILGVPTPKDGMDGGQVWDFFKANRIEEIAEYCRRDVVATRECWKRMNFS